MFQIYAVCVYLFFTVCFWVLIISFAYRMQKERGAGFVWLFFFLSSFLCVPFLWPFFMANILIKRLTEGQTHEAKTTKIK